MPRRGLATVVHGLSDDTTIERVLRRSSVRVTEQAYVKTLPRQATDAMLKRNEGRRTGYATLGSPTA